jgi:hypothetical protein
MKPLFTAAQRQRLLTNGQRQNQVRGTEKEIDFQPVVKLFTPDANCTWLLTEIDPTDSDTAFGLCDLGVGCPELGYVSLSELAAVRGRLGLPVERDLYFKADKTLGAYAQIASDNEHIVA